MATPALARSRGGFDDDCRRIAMKPEVVDGNIERRLGQPDKTGDAASHGIDLRDALRNFSKWVIALLLKKHDLDSGVIAA